MELSQALHRITTGDCNRSSASDSSASSHHSARSLTYDPIQQMSESEASDTDLNVKPTLPYAPGLLLTATRHEPPEPFGIGYDTDLPPAKENWESLSQTEHCFSRPPLGGHTICGESKTLAITAIIRTGYDRGAQLVVVNDTMVAKIYDPLYYEGVNEYGYKQNVVWDADGDYSREALAYKELQKSPAALKVTPAFHGTWIIGIDTLIRQGRRVQKHMRQVPLVLVEYLRGVTMENVSVPSLSLQMRSNILEKALHAEAILYNAGISHDDFCPRNIMIINLDYDNRNDATNDTAVKVIDFNVATVVHHPQYHYRMYHEEEKIMRKWDHRLLSPIVRYFWQMNEFSTFGWCSCEDGAPEQWLWEHFHNDERYVPVVWDPSNPDIRPDYEDVREEQEKSSDSGVGLDMETKDVGESEGHSGFFSSEEGTSDIQAR